jgi:hypothetical protein
MFGGDEGIRTLGLCVANASLSHLSYIPTQKAILNDLARISTVIFTWDITTEAQRAQRIFFVFREIPKNKKVPP